MMKNTLKIFLELVAVFVLTFALSLEYIFIANTYSIPYLSCVFFLAYFLCCWLCHRACGMHDMRFGVAITALACIFTFFLVESILHKDEKGCQNWILEVIESATNSRLLDECGACSGKEQSFDAAMKILREYNDIAVFDNIKTCEDVDALRMIACTAHLAAWPMKAGPNVDFDNKMDGIFRMAMQRLFEIDSDGANETIESCKHAFSSDGAYSLFFTELEGARKILRSKHNEDGR